MTTLTILFIMFGKHWCLVFGLCICVDSKNYSAVCNFHLKNVQNSKGSFQKQLVNMGEGIEYIGN